MASKEELQAVLDRVEAAYGRDREIDAAIAYVVGEAPEGDGWELLTHSPGRHNMDAGRWLRGQILRTPTPYTSSIDAALALVERVLPGWAWSLNGFKTAGGIDVCVLQDPPEGKVVSENGSTPPLAAIAALLRALISQAEDA